ncbi:MAG: hypothetical protein EZS28_016726 [Streblomastix strix]|uniref:Phospholipase B-like n=1 Tax=Streblomastix strix TaxID=222440 RepID=A0A5J4VZT5_9EUKA|nr:MAG: hypothetical protein EZS28_016726 [Streblomastix strix]
MLCKGKSEVASAFARVAFAGRDGWGKIEISQLKDTDPNELAFMFGALEGFAFHNEILSLFQNIDSILFEGVQEDLKEYVYDFVSKNLEFVETEKYNSDLMTNQKALFDGLVFGYGKASTYDTALTKQQLWLISMLSEVRDLINLYTKDKTVQEYDLADKYFLNGRGITILKLVYGNQELFLGQNVWSSYSQLVKLHRTYYFLNQKQNEENKNDIRVPFMSMSGYPGVLGSGDEFFTLSNGIGIAGNHYDIIYSQNENQTYSISEKGFPFWMRIMSANIQILLNNSFNKHFYIENQSSAGQIVADNIMQNPLSIGNVQLIVVDYNKFKTFKRKNGNQQQTQYRIIKQMNKLTNSTAWLIETVPYDEPKSKQNSFHSKLSNTSQNQIKRNEQQSYTGEDIQMLDISDILQDNMSFALTSIPSSELAYQRAGYNDYVQKDSVNKSLHQFKLFLFGRIEDNTTQFNSVINFRAKIIENEQKKVHDIEGFKYLIRYNDYSSDTESISPSREPSSKKDKYRDPCYSISPRCELRKIEKQAIAIGAIDAKVTSWLMMQDTNFISQLGPTLSHQLPHYNVTQLDSLSHFAHNGVPEEIDKCRWIQRDWNNSLKISTMSLFVLFASILCLLILIAAVVFFIITFIILLHKERKEMASNIKMYEGIDINVGFQTE